MSGYQKKKETSRERYETNANYALFAEFQKWATWDRVEKWLISLERKAVRGNVRAAEILLARTLPERVAVDLAGRVEHDHRHLHGVVPVGVVPLEKSGSDTMPASIRLLDGLVGGVGGVGGGGGVVVSEKGGGEELEAEVVGRAVDGVVEVMGRQRVMEWESGVMKVKEV